MVVLKEKKNIKVVGLKIAKTDDEFNYYLAPNFTSEKQKRGWKILFTGEKKDCENFLNKNY